MGEKQTGFIGREVNPSTIIVAMRPITLIAKKMRAQRVPADKNFKGWTRMYAKKLRFSLHP
jgi:hypothetical protein